MDVCVHTHIHTYIYIYVCIHYIYIYVYGVQLLRRDELQALGEYSKEDTSLEANARH